MGKKKKQTVGYRYYLGIQYAYCQGPIDKVTHLYWDEDLAWAGDWAGGILTIRQANLFGGDDKEGGIEGDFRLWRGHELTADPYLVSQLGVGNVSAFYGVTHIVGIRPYLGNSPYLKPQSAVIQAGEWQWPGMPQWNLPMAKIPYNATFGSGGGSTGPEWDDDALREGMDIWIVFPSSGVSEDGHDFVPFAEAVRTAINARLIGIKPPETPVSKKVGLGIAYGGYASKRQGGSNGEYYTATNSRAIEGDTATPARWGQFTDYNIAQARLSLPGTIAGGGVPAYYGGTMGNMSEAIGFSYVLAAVNGGMGRNTARLGTYKHGMLIYLGQQPSAADWNQIAQRYISAGGTFQYHKMRPAQFRRTKSPYDFFQSRVTKHVVDIMENRYPLGSDTALVTFNDGINLNATAVQGDRPSQKGYDVNPVHILRECIVSPIIGLGEPPSSVDAPRANYTAALMHGEGFGLSMKWSQEGPVEDFMQQVCDHANITCYVSNRTGLWVIKAIRGDYDKNTIPRLTEESHILDVETLTRRLPSEGINAITVKYYDIDRNDTASIPVYNTAAIQQKGGVIDQTTVFYDGILREDLAYAVGERDLLTLGYPLVTGAIFVDRRSHYFEPGDVFWLDAPSYGILNEVMRVVDVDYGNDEEHRIRIELSSDIYSLEPQPMDRGAPYVPPNVSQPPVPMVHQFVEETPYYLASQELGKPAVDASLAADPDAGGIVTFGTTPAGSLASAQIWATMITPEDWQQHLTMEFAPAVLVTTSVTDNPLEEALHYDVSWTPSEISSGDLAWFDGEMVRVKSIDYATRTVVVARGVFDTVPMNHPTGGMLILLEGFGGYIDDNLTADMEFAVRLLPFSGNQVLDPTLAPVSYVVMNSRAIRPYPAADVKVNGSYQTTLDSWAGVYEFTWVHRNRMQQQHLLQGFTEAGLTPEPGVTYHLRISAWEIDGTRLPNVYDADIGVVDTVTVDLADHALPLNAAKVAVEIVAVRDGYDNWTNTQLSYVAPYTRDMGFAGLWWDSNIPESLSKNRDRTGEVTKDLDNVRNIANVYDTLPGTDTGSLDP